MKYIIFGIAAMISIKVYNQQLLTFFEQSNYKRTPRYDSTIFFCKLLAQKADFINYTTFGKSHENRDLPLLIVAKGKEFTPEKAKQSGKNIVLIQACIHAGEPDGKDAGFLLLRDMIEKKELQQLLNDNIILFIPILNVDGHERFGPYNRINQNGPVEMGWRTNARNLNLNRDYLKAQTAEIQAWLNLFHSWNPHFFIDLHVTDGADYQYPITYALEIYGNMDSAITQWQKEKLIPELHAKMENSGYPIFRYVSFRNWFDFQSGLSAWITPPSLSQGYTALVNCPGLLIESHMLKDYKTRVFGSYYMIVHTLSVLSKEKNNLQQLANRVSFNKKLTLTYKQTTDSTMVEFKGVEYTVETSDLTGGKWYKYSKIPKTHILPFFETFVHDKIIQLPDYYIIPSAWADFFKEYFKLHHIQYSTLLNDSNITATFYKFSDVKLSSNSFEGCQRVNSFKTDTIKRTVTFLKGSLLVPTRQPNYKILAHLIEPEAPASLFNFGFFNSIFEQKEYGEPYVLEPLAREMLKNDDIKNSFENYRNQNPKASSYEILNWFYNRSPYADQWLNVYPIGKVYKTNL